MPLPDFTPDEQFLVDGLKSKAVGRSSSYMWSYLFAGVVFAVIAAYQESMPTLLFAFAWVCAHRIYEERFQAKWVPVWRSIFDKYEAAALRDGGDSDENGGQS